MVDELILDFREIISAASMLEPTKRHIVSIVGKFYDPLGLVTPLIFRFKILVQDLCKAQVPWDRILHGELLERWQSLICDRSHGTLLIHLIKLIVINFVGLVTPQMLLMQLLCFF